MKIVADSAIPFLQGVLEPWAEVRYLPGSRIAAEDVRDADALIIRTRTRCDGRLLAGSRVRLIASMQRILREINRKDRFRRSLKAALFSIYPTKKHFSARMRRLPRGNSFLLPANGEVRIRDSYPTRSPRLYPLCRKD